MWSDNLLGRRFSSCFSEWPLQRPPDVGCCAPARQAGAARGYPSAPRRTGIGAGRIPFRGECVYLSTARLAEHRGSGVRAPLAARGSSITSRKKYSQHSISLAHIIGITVRVLHGAAVLVCK